MSQSSQRSYTAQYRYLTSYLATQIITLTVPWQCTVNSNSKVLCRATMLQKIAVGGDGYIWMFNFRLCPYINITADFWALILNLCWFSIYWAKSLTHWGRVTHICVSKLTIIGSDNGLSPDRRQAIIWTNAGLLLIWPLGTNFSEILVEILTFSFKKMRLKVSSAKRRPFCLCLNVLTYNRKIIGPTIEPLGTPIGPVRPHLRPIVYT